MRRIQIYGTGSASAAAVANATFPTAGKLRGAQCWLVVDSVTDNSRVVVEFSRVPTGQLNTNAAVEPIISLAHQTNIGAAGHDSNGINVWCPLDVDIRAGEIVYLHAYVTGTATYYANAIFNYA